MDAWFFFDMLDVFEVILAGTAKKGIYRGGRV
jgi:hypothetical protein